LEFGYSFLKRLPKATEMRTLPFTVIYKLRKRTLTVPALPNSIMFRPSPNPKSPLAGVLVGADRAVDVGLAETEFVSMFATVSLSVVTEAMWPSKSVNPVKLDDALPKVIGLQASALVPSSTPSIQSPSVLRKHNMDKVKPQKPFWQGLVEEEILLTVPMSDW
jgi:hypothetical protein